VLSTWRAERAAARLNLAEPVHDLREIVNAILYVACAGCAWHDLQPASQRIRHDHPQNDRGRDRRQPEYAQVLQVRPGQRNRISAGHVRSRERITIL
jgi:transposase